MFKNTKKIITLIIINVLLINNTFANLNNEIRGLKGPRISLEDFITYQFIIIFLLVFVYIYYTFFLSKKNLIKDKIDALGLKKKSIILGLRKLKKDSDIFAKSDFYSQTNKYFREYFSILNIQNSDILSLSDVKKLDLDKELITLFEKSYLNEFNDKNDLKKTRIDMIDSLIKFIK